MNEKINTMYKIQISAIRYIFLSISLFSISLFLFLPFFAVYSNITSNRSFPHLRLFFLLLFSFSLCRSLSLNRLFPYGLPFVPTKNCANNISSLYVFQSLSGFPTILFKLWARLLWSLVHGKTMVVIQEPLGRPWFFNYMVKR